MSASRKTTRVIDLTPESIAALPTAKDHMSVWWDKDHPYFGVRKPEYNPTPDYVLELDKHQRRAAERRTGRPQGRLVRLGRIPFEDAKTMALTMWKDLKEASVRGGAIPDRDASAVPETILEDREKVENPNYDLLMSALMDAYQQAASGKGSERHGFGLNFEDQDLLAITSLQGLGFPLGQAIKKLCEGRRLDRDLARKEFLGAIVYIAGAIVWLDKQE